MEHTTYDDELRSYDTATTNWPLASVRAYAMRTLDRSLHRINKAQLGEGQVFSFLFLSNLCNIANWLEFLTHVCTHICILIKLLDTIDLIVGFSDICIKK